MSEKSLGSWGERQAERHLVQGGLEILDRNWHCSQGEIDLIARDGRQLVFVEVKTRRSQRFGAPEEALTVRKRRRIQRAAWTYLEQHDKLQAQWRVDVVAVVQNRAGELDRLEHFENALEAESDLEQRL